MTPIDLPGAAALEKAGALLVRADDRSWDELLPLLQQLESHSLPTWQALAMATLETLARSKACEALGRDPWSSVAPLITELLNGFARHIPVNTGRGIKAIEALFEQLATAEPITWPDGLPGAVVALAGSWAGSHGHLIAALARAVDQARLRELLACKRTTRRELKSLRRIAGEPRLVAVIDGALQPPTAAVLS